MCIRFSLLSTVEVMWLTGSIVFCLQFYCCGKTVWPTFSSCLFGAYYSKEFETMAIMIENMAADRQVWHWICAWDLDQQPWHRRRLLTWNGVDFWNLNAHACRGPWLMSGIIFHHSSTLSIEKRSYSQAQNSLIWLASLVRFLWGSRVSTFWVSNNSLAAMPTQHVHGL